MNDTEKKWATIVALIVGAFLLINLISWIWMPFLPYMQDRQAGEETIEQTYDSEEAIQTYEEFRVLHAEIEEQRNQVENSEEALRRFNETYGDDPSEWSRTTKEEKNRLEKRYTGNKQQLEGLVSDYNAKSRQANTELFKCSLPHQVDDRLEVNGPPGSGAPDEPIQDTDINGDPVDGEPVKAEQCDGLPDEIQR